MPRIHIDLEELDDFDALEQSVGANAAPTSAPTRRDSRGQRFPNAEAAERKRNERRKQFVRIKRKA